MSELKPCPFCGGNRIMVTNWGLWKTWCADCKSETSSYLTEKEAVEAWNRRVGEE